MSAAFQLLVSVSCNVHYVSAVGDCELRLHNCNANASCTNTQYYSIARARLVSLETKQSINVIER